jgi:hypothetical protein
MNGIGSIGAAMRERFARENKPGALSYVGFDAWWNGGLRSTPAFHNMHGILTETALYGYATPGEYKVKEIPARFANGMPTREPSIFYDRPWMGGRWRLMDAVEYILTSDFALLDHAARQRPLSDEGMGDGAGEHRGGQRGGPFAYVVPPDQHDAWSAREMLWRLQAGGLRGGAGEGGVHGGRAGVSGGDVRVAGGAGVPVVPDGSDGAAEVSGDPVGADGSDEAAVRRGGMDVAAADGGAGGAGGGPVSGAAWRSGEGGAGAVDAGRAAERVVHCGGAAVEGGAGDCGGRRTGRS